MTEAEWLACADPTAMLQHLGQAISDRKLRLFSLACCRRLWSYVKDERIQTALDILERYADKEASDKERLAARKGITAFRAQHYDEHREEEICIASELWIASTKTMRKMAHRCGTSTAAAFAWADVSDYNARLPAERAAQTSLLREIAGNPFREIAFAPAWRTDTAVSLAKGMYDSRDFGAMPILADALQDAGCDDSDTLSHCRQPAEHVRGCWVLDLVLDKK